MRAQRFSFKKRTILKSQHQRNTKQLRLAGDPVFTPPLTRVFISYRRQVFAHRALKPVLKQPLGQLIFHHFFSNRYTFTSRELPGFKTPSRDISALGRDINLRSLLCLTVDWEHLAFSLYSLRSQLGSDSRLNLHQSKKTIPPINGLCDFDIL